MRVRIIAALVSLFAVVPMFADQDLGSKEFVFVDLEKVFASDLVSSKFESLKIEFDRRHDEFQASQDRLEEMVAEYEKESAMMTKIVRENREQELRDIANKLSKQGAEMTQEYYARQQDLKSKYLTQIENIAQRVASKYGSKMILTRHNMLFGAPELDITEEIVRDLK